MTALTVLAAEVVAKPHAAYDKDALGGKMAFQEFTWESKREYGWTSKNEDVESVCDEGRRASRPID